MPKHDDDDDIVEVRCPKCQETVKLPREEAERAFMATCSNGHEFPLVKAL